MHTQTGKIIIILGVILVVVGVLIYYFGGRGFMPGKLPGDLSWGNERMKVYFPITTMIILSLLLSLLMYLMRK